MNEKNVRECLKSFSFKRLFIEELGWDRHAHCLRIKVGEIETTLEAVAQKRGLTVYVCSPLPDGSIPDYAVRARIEKEVARHAHEHLLIFADQAKSSQVWQWVRREPGKPIARRENRYHVNQTGEALIQRLRTVEFTLQEEDELGIVDVTSRVRAAFDVEKVTKKFYDLFKKEHDAFLKGLSGITDDEMERWYVSVMLNRLMFIYFIERKGFLNGDIHYLRTKLDESGERGKDLYYQDFLCPLFFEGFAKQQSDRSARVNKLLGSVPYLNGGLFLKHQIEELYGQKIVIADAVFRRLFDFFDRYQWHLDERPLRKDNEINPDVLGYIFEKYINQKQMGAYYTKEDITGYISRNTIIPFLLDAAAKGCKAEFEPGGPVWRLLADDPDRYIYEPVRKGVDIPLPDYIEAGIKDVAKRTRWNEPAGPDHALPTEIWREHVARRLRCLELREKLAKGEVHAVNYLITYNLDIEQFVQDVIANAESPQFVWEFFKAVRAVTVLDPTCGSGAFLFAALNILESIYEALLERIRQLLSECADFAKAHPNLAKEFKLVLEEADRHPSAKYFIYKSITVNNLYGVDIMEEAVEICKLRLFLKLVAQVEDADKIEPLPDIDFNIRAGNTLVGFASLEELKKAAGNDWVKQQAVPKIEEAAEIADLAFRKFREMQTKRGMDSSEFSSAKSDLQQRLAKLRNQLDRYLAEQYGLVSGVKNYDKVFEAWKSSHHPFHWFTEFYGIVARGGFDVIIGNPPYAEVPKELGRSFLTNTYSTALDRWSRDEDLYTYVVERSLRLLIKEMGQFGMILPLSVTFSTKKPFFALRKIMSLEKGLWLLSHYDRIPSALFGNEVRTRCTVALLSRLKKSEIARAATTSLLRWNAEYRNCLFNNLHYSCLDIDFSSGIAKVGSQVQADVLCKLINAKLPLELDLNHSLPFNYLASLAPNFPQPCVFIGGTAYNWFPAWRDIPETTNMDGAPSLPARTAGFQFSDEEQANIIFSLLCSSLGYWWWAVASDGFNLKKWLLERFPVSLSMIPAENRTRLARLGADLRQELKQHYVYKENKGRIGNYFLPACKQQATAIDEYLGRYVPPLSLEFFEDIRNFNECFSRAELASQDGDIDLGDE